MASLIVRNDPSIEEILRSHPFIRTGKTLSGNFLILTVPDENILTVIEKLGNTKLDSYSLVVGLMGEEALEAAGITPILQQPFLDLKGRGVLLGFIDTGIDYTQDAFIYEDGSSKIQFIWDQTIEGSAPGDYGFGTEYSNAQLNQALQTENPFDVVPHRDNVGHGTFLASVAGSRQQGENAGAAPDARIIAVKLRKASPFYYNTFLIPPEQENAYESIDVMMGVEYILDKAIDLRSPVAICISVGTNLGGHDGFNIFEEYLTRISHRSGVTVCCAAGNESNTGHHTSGFIDQTGKEKQIEIVAGKGTGDIYFTLWNHVSDRVSVSVKSPTGELVGRVPAKNGTVVAERLVFEKSSVIIYYFFPIEESGSQLTVVKILSATPGIWTVQAYGDIIINGKYNAWLPITGFINSDVQFLTPTPECTIVVPASATGVIACGAFNSLDNSLYSASSWGPTRLPMLVPDLTAPGVEVSGTFPTGSGTLAGTSVAAAITTGACALLLQWGVVEGNEPLMDTYLARANLIRGCERASGIKYPNNQWGYGQLNLENTFNTLRRTQN